MKYKLCRASIEPDHSHATLWYANPNCILEKPHKLLLFDSYQIDYLTNAFTGGPVPSNDLPIDMLPEEFQCIQAKFVEVPIGLHKHVSRKINGRPVFTRFLHVFVPLVRCECAGNLYAPLYDPRYLAQEQINRYWIPVEED